MKKRNKIIYWIATIWMSLGMVSSGLVQIIHMDEEVEMMTRLGYPLYFLTIIGVWKMFGVVAVLVPRYPLLKEWAYAGFFFTMSGAVISHLASGDPFTESIPPLFLLLLTLVSWSLRPADRRISTAKAV